MLTTLILLSHGDYPLRETLTMGVPEKPDGDHAIEVVCSYDDCETDTFWTDETMANDCPECYRGSATPANQ